MKFVRPLLIAFSLIVVIFAVIVAVVLIPSVQRRLVLRAVANQPGLKLDIRRVSARLSSLSLSGVQMEERGIKISAEQVEMNYSIWPALFSHRVSVRNLTITGLLVDASRMSQEKVQVAAVGGPAVAPGMLTEIKLPFELVLDDCQLKGRVLLPTDPGQSPVEAVFDIKGGKFSPGEEGLLRLTATVKNPAANADVGTLHAQVSLRATQTKQRTFNRVSLTAVVNAAGPTLSEQNQLKIITELEKGAAGENYSLSIDTLMGGKAENILGLHAILPAGQSDYSGQWTLKARTAQLAPFFLGLALPDFDAQGEGKIAYTPSTRATALQGNLDVGASRLEVINPAWKAIGPVKLQAQFDASAEGPIARLRQLDVKLSGEKPVLELSASQAAEVNFNDRRLRVGGVAAGEALNLKLKGVPLAWIAPFIPDLTISGGAITGEFSITGGTDRMLLRGVQPLRIDQLTISQRTEALLSKATLSLALDAVLTDKELQAKVGEFILQTSAGDLFKSQATLSIPVASHPPVSLQASYTADLPTLLTPWLPKGHVKASGNTDLSVVAGKVEMRSLTTNVTDANGAFLFKASTLHSFVFDPSTGRTTGEKSTGDLAQIALGRIPLDWLPVNEPGAIFAGTIEPSAFVMRVEGEKLSLRSTTPFKLAAVSFVQDGETALTGLGIEASPLVEISGGNVSTQTGEVTVRNAAGSIVLTSKGEAVLSPTDGMRTNFIFTLEIPALSSQPFFSGTRVVSGGRASGELRATVSKKQDRQIEARITLNGLVAREGGQLLPVANLSFRALVDESGKVSVQAPLFLDRAGVRSDLNFSLDLTPVGKDFSLDGKITGEHLELTDAMSVLGVFSTNAARASEPDKPQGSLPQEIAVDKVSAWSRFKGQLLLDVKSATAGKDWSMTGLTGTVTLDPALISLPKLEAAFGEKSRLAAKAEIKFSPGAMPYQLKGEFTLTEFDTAKFFKSIEPSKAPTIEGLFNVTGRFAGGGETMERTMSHTHGRFDLNSRQGVFRGLQRTTGKVSMASKAVEMGASVLGSLFGSEKATKAAEKVAGQAYFVDQLAQGLSEFNYDQLNVRLVRDESLNLTMEDIGLISPEIRLLGKGAITYVPGKSLLEQPMTASFSLAARGKVEQLLGKLHLVDGTRDEVGYARTKDAVTVGGSLAKPDPTAFFTKIAAAKLNDLLDTD